MFSLIKFVKFKTRIKFECYKLYEMQKFMWNTQYLLQFMTFCDLYAYLFEMIIFIHQNSRKTHKNK